MLLQNHLLKISKIIFAATLRAIIRCYKDSNIIRVDGNISI